tara:strand:- start:3056 stop:3556 length:501 start_codon:yes stop_codon:yes gene_type:complete
MAVDQALFREAMSTLAASVTIITTDGPGGRHGMTATAVCSVSDEPATVLACINRASTMNARVKQNGVMCLNVLGGHHQDLSMLFANPRISIEDRFAKADWGRSITGSPVLKNALIALDCEVSEITEVGTHSVFFGKLTDLAIATEHAPLLYFGRGFHTLKPQGAAA